MVRVTPPRKDPTTMVARAGTRAGSRHTASWPLSPSRRLALSRGRGGRGGRRKGTEVVDTHPKNLSSLLLPHFSSIMQTPMSRISTFLVTCRSNMCGKAACTTTTSISMHVRSWWRCASVLHQELSTTCWSNMCGGQICVGRPPAHQ